MYNEDKKNKDLENRLKQVLNTDECNTEECKLKDPQELVYRENKKIITNDGRQLLSEYVTR